MVDRYVPRGRASAGDSWGLRVPPRGPTFAETLGGILAYGVAVAGIVGGVLGFFR